MYSRKIEKQRGRLETREYYYTEETEWIIRRNKEWKEAGTEKVLHNEYSRESGRICKSGKRTLGNRKLSLDTGCDIQRRCKQGIEQKCGKKLKYSKEISNLNTRIAAVQKEI